MPFHRYVDPTYNLLGGSFPGAVGAQTYDRLNVVSGGVGGGNGSANADGTKVGGPNAGTYLVAFGENATSSFANRGLRALGENTDFLDDIVRGNIPRPTRANFSSPGGNTLTLTGLDVFAGDVAGVSPSSLIQVFDQSTGLQLYSSTGSPIVVTEIDNGSPPTLVGSGFVTGPRITFSSAVTSPITLIYGGRASWANAIETPNRNMVFALAMEAFRRGMYGESTSRHGLNERYRRGTGLGPQPDDFTANTPGAGSKIVRDGRALVVEEPDLDYTSSRPDDFLALFRAQKNQAEVAASDANKEGTVGFMSLSNLRSGSVELGDPGANLYDFAAIQRRNVDSDNVGGTGNTFTRVPAGAAVSMNPGGVGNNVLRLTGTAYWAKNFSGTIKTGLRLDHDLLLVERASGVKELFRPTALRADLAEIEVEAVTGPAAPFTINDEVGAVEWLQPSWYHAGSQEESLVWTARNFNGDGGSLNADGAAFYAGSLYRSGANVALAWGGHDQESGDLLQSGYVEADGRLETRLVHAALAEGPFTVKNAAAYPYTDSHTFNIDPFYGARDASHHVLYRLESGTGSEVVNISVFPPGSTPDLGTRLSVMFFIPSALGAVNLTWGTDFKFSPGDDQIPAGAGFWKFNIFYVERTGYMWRVTREFMSI